MCGPAIALVGVGAAIHGAREAQLGLMINTFNGAVLSPFEVFGRFGIDTPDRTKTVLWSTLPWRAERQCQSRSQKSGSVGGLVFGGQITNVTACRTPLFG